MTDNGNTIPSPPPAEATGPLPDAPRPPSGGPHAPAAAARTSTIRPPPPPKKTLSGSHPIVAAYRRKLESIADDAEKGSELDRELSEYLAELADGDRPTPIP